MTHMTINLMEGMATVRVIPIVLSPSYLPEMGTSEKDLPTQQHTTDDDTTQSEVKAATMTTKVYNATYSVDEQVPVPCPPKFPPELWPLVCPRQKRQVEARFALYTETMLTKVIKDIVDGLDIWKDGLIQFMAFYRPDSYKQYCDIDKYEHRSQRDFLMAQALANLDIFSHPDPDNPRPVKAPMVDINTTDEIPTRGHTKRWSPVQQAFLEQKTGMMLRTRKLQTSTSDWCHGLVLVPYQSKINEFLDRHGDDATTAMFLPEHETEVCGFYRLTSDLRTIN
jgi:hypothetical protein